MAIVHQRGWDAGARHESPWYFPVRGLWDTFAAHGEFPSPAELSALYAARVGALSEVPTEARRLRFVSAPPKKRKKGALISLGELYEGRIVERSEVPTREGDWHDFFNALTFVAFPRAKWALHQRQYQLLAGRVNDDTRRLPGARTREQDALALFDEGGIALIVDANHAPRLDVHPDAFDAIALDLCRLGAAVPVPFGHALPEHLVEGLPCPLGTAHVVCLPDPRDDPEKLLDVLDRALFADLSDPTQFVTPSPARGLSLPTLSAVARLPTRSPAHTG